MLGQELSTNFNCEKPIFPEINIKKTSNLSYEASLMNIDFPPPPPPLHKKPQINNITNNDGLNYSKRRLLNGLKPSTTISTMNTSTSSTFIKDSTKPVPKPRNNFQNYPTKTLPFRYIIISFNIIKFLFWWWDKT